MAVDFGHCNKCIRNGDLHIEHGERLFRSFEELGAYLHGLATEYKLLKRIVDGGIGTDEDMLDDFWSALVEQEWVDKDYPPMDLSAICVMKEGSFDNDYRDWFEKHQARESGCFYS